MYSYPAYAADDAGFRWLRNTVLIVLACVAPLSGAASALDVEQLWVANPDMVMEGAAMVADLDGDGDDEVLTAAYENMIVVDGDGQELWRYDTRGRYSTCPAILERDGKPPLIYAGDSRGKFTCLNGNGEIEWQVETAPIFCASPALADLDGNGSMEVVQGDKQGGVTVRDALTGELVWTKEIDGECASPALGDLDGDGSLEIVISTGAGKVFAISATGDVVWEFNVGAVSPDWATCSPVMFGNSRGEVCVAAASHKGRFVCLDSSGDLMWERTTRGAIASTLSVGDFDADGHADIFVVTQLGVLYRFDEEGRVLWDIDTQGRSLASGAIIDVDGDSVLEYVLCTQQGNLLVFNNSGEVVFNHQFDNRTINVTAAFGDIVKRRPGLEFAITGGESGQIFCFGIPASVQADAQWRTYRCDNRLTGAWFGPTSSDRARMTPENLSWNGVLTGGELVYRIVNPNPGDEPLRAEAICVGPDGSRQAAVGKIVGERGLLQMPVSVNAPGVYRFEWRLSDHTGERLVSESRSLTLQPYANDRALAEHAVIVLREAIGEAGATANDRGIAAAMRKEVSAIEEESRELASLQRAVPSSTSAFAEQVNARTAALNARAKRALALAKVAEAVQNAGEDVRAVAFEGVMWENRDVDTQLPDGVSIPLRISRRSVTGEHEPVSIKLLNVTPDTLRISGNAPAAANGPSVALYEVQPVPTNQNTVAWDPIVPLNGREIAIPSLETREVWVDVDLEGVAAGSHAVEVAFESGAWRMDVQIDMDVLPFEMAGVGAMRMCNWAHYSDVAIKDLLAHGNSVFITGLPHATVHERDTTQFDIDFTALDEFIAKLTGYDVFLLFSGIPRLGVPMESDAYVERIAEYLERVMSHLMERGIDEEHVALYPHDEPGGHGWDTIHHYIAFGRQVLKARPSVNFYVNGGGDLPMFEALNEVASVWCPGYYMLPEDTPEMNFLRRSGKTIWSYDCGYSYARPIGANTKTINVAGQYRMAAPFALNFGATGIGYWSYNIGDGMWDAAAFEYPLVYVDAERAHTSSRRWEAVREGLEDARILIALRDRLSDDRFSEETKAKIRHVLDETLPGMAYQSLEEVRIGLARYVLDASNNDATVAAFRQELLDCVEALVE